MRFPFSRKISARITARNNLVFSGYPITVEPENRVPALVAILSPLSAPSSFNPISFTSDSMSPNAFFRIPLAAFFSTVRSASKHILQIYYK